MEPTELLLFALLILGSAYLSASEIALFSLSKFQLRFLKDSVRGGTYRKIKRLLQDPGGLLVTTLAMNEVFNVSISSLITKNVALRPGQVESSTSWLTHLWIGTAISAPLVLFVCEITPKVVGARANQLVATLAAGPLSFAYDLLKPARMILTTIVSLVSRGPYRGRRPASSGSPDNPPGAAPETLLKESEFLMMVEEGHKQGAIHQRELDLIRNVFELDDTRVDAIYTPLSQVQTVQGEMTLKNALLTLKSRRFSRVPVTSANRRQIVGVLYFKDLLRAKLDPRISELPVSELMRKPMLVGPSLQLAAVFRKFKQHKTHLAVVQKPTGETLGIVTMSDVLESLFDDLLGEADA